MKATVFVRVPTAMKPPCNMINNFNKTFRWIHVLFLNILKYTAVSKNGRSTTGL